jgi:Cdc6-like AAA superfamily ATPase
MAARTFTPSAPVNKLDLLAGRSDLLLEVVNASMAPGQHSLLYGERGVGKTSLTNVLGEVLEKVETESFRTSKVNCTTTDDFDSIWAVTFHKLGVDLDDVRQRFTPEGVRLELERIRGFSLIVFDEIDRLQDDDALSLMADTIKTLSDNADTVGASLVLVGVADSVTELIGDHQSIERALVQILMPRMSKEDLTSIVTTGIERLELTIESLATERIASLSEGLPHYTHLLALNATQQAIKNDRTHVNSDDVDFAIKQAVNKVQESIRQSYHQAIRSPRPKNLYAEVLLACALSQKDDLGYFTAASVQEPLEKIMNRERHMSTYLRHLGEFTKIDRGPLLHTTGDKNRTFYRFANPMLQPFAILNGIASGKISQETVNFLQSRRESGFAPPTATGKLFDLPPTSPNP